MGSAASSGEKSTGAGTILLVEDNPAYIRLVRELLTEAGLDGFELEWADLLEKGLDRLEAGGIDLVLLDLLLPDNMGTNTLQVVLERTETTPVVVLTGIEDDDLAREALEMGATDYLCKGRLDADRLARSVRYALSETTTTDAPDPSPGPIETDRVIPVAAERLESAVDCLDTLQEHLDPLAPEDSTTAVTEEQDRCRRVAQGLREIADLFQDDAPQERLSLHDVLDDALVRLSANGLAGGRVTLTWTEPPQVLGQRDRLVRLFELTITQMLSRPFDEPAHVRVTATQQGDRYEVRLHDDTPPPNGADPLGHLFATSTDDEHLSGALARTLCEAIAASHGGRMWVEGDQDGTALAVTLPGTSASVEADAARPRRGRHRKSL